MVSRSGFKAPVPTPCSLFPVHFLTLSLVHFFTHSLVHLFPCSLVPCLHGICAIGSSITGVRFPSFSAYAHSP